MVYYKKDKEVEVSSCFIYLEEIYLMYPNRCELFRTKNYTSKTPINKTDSCAYSSNYDCYIQRYWELTAAPEQYLKSKGFKLKHE